MLRLKLRHVFERLVSLPKCLALTVLGRGRVVINGVQRWEPRFRVCYDRGSLEVGKACNFRRNSTLRLVGGELRIGDQVFMNENVSITCMNRVTIGNGVKIANNTVIVDHDHDYANDNVGYAVGSVVIEDGVWIGANCTILKDTHIGRGCVIAAGSVVKGTVPGHTIYGGALAKEIKSIQAVER